MKKLLLTIMMMVICHYLFAQTRIKDISFFSGLESRELMGYGLVVGLDGTGDGSSSQMTVQSIKNMLERFGINIPMNKIRPNNVAAVMVTGTLPAFAKIGAKFDVNVSSIGDAKSLEGGTLLFTPLSATDGNHYAMAQGQVSIGGFNSTEKGSKTRKNYANVAKITDGAVIEKELFSQILNNGELVLNLYNSDFTSAQRISEAINKEYQMKLSSAEDAISVSIIVPDSIIVRRNLVGFISKIENLEIIPEQKAKVVINERTGTIVAGGNVRISEVAISHANLTIEIIAWKTDVNRQPVSSTEDGKVMVISATTVQELARSLNSIKVTPRDLVAIFQSLKVAGALQAELSII